MDISNALAVSINREQRSLTLNYVPRTARTIYDLCDLNGRVIRTGPIFDRETTLDISDLNGRGYVMLIVDGDTVLSKRISLAT